MSNLYCLPAEPGELPLHLHLYRAGHPQHPHSIDRGIIAYGAIGATIIGLVRPVFIPWMIFSKTEFLFWGWLRAFVGSEFYKVVAAATMSVTSHLLITYLTSGANNVSNPERLVTLMPGLLILCVVAGITAAVLRAI